MTNILIIRYTEKVSGAETYNGSLITGLQKTSANIQLIYITNNTQFASYIRNYGVKVYIVPTIFKEIGTKKELLKGIIHAPFFIVSYMKVIRAINAQYPFRVICLQSFSEKLFLTAFLKILGKKVLWVEHGPFFFTTRAEIVKKLYVFMSNFTNGIIAVSENTKRDIQAHVKRVPIEHVTTGLDTNFFKPVHKKTPLRKFTIGFLGTISVEKGIDEFLGVAVCLLKMRKDVQFLIVGEGPYYSKLLEKIESLQIKQFITCTGFQSNVKPFLDQMDILLLPTNHQEGISMALLEALAMEIIVITRDIGGNSEVVIPKITGFLYDRFDPEELSAQIVTILTKPNSCSKLKKEARRLIMHKYSLSHMVSDFMRVCMTV